jgi:hypothetical protein
MCMFVRRSLVVNRLREECNVSELKAKLQEKAERCRELETELQEMKDYVDRLVRSVFVYQVRI